MRRLSVYSAILLLAAACASPALASGNVNFVLGARTLTDDGYWNNRLFFPEDFSSQFAFAANVDFGPASWPLRLEAGVNGSAKKTTVFGNDFTATVSDGFFGVHKTWNLEKGKLHPFVGGGVASVTTKIEFLGNSREDTSSGWYVHGGFFYRLGRRFNIGLDARALRGTGMTISGIDFDSDNNQVGLLLGWGWPAAK